MVAFGAIKFLLADCRAEKGSSNYKAMRIYNTKKRPLYFNEFLPVKPNKQLVTDWFTRTFHSLGKLFEIRSTKARSSK